MGQNGVTMEGKVCYSPDTQRMEWGGGENATIVRLDKKLVR